MNIAQGSLEECRYYLILSKDLEYGENLDVENLSEEVSKLLTAYIKAIKTSKF
jgi:four helix bundle protein